MTIFKRAAAVLLALLMLLCCGCGSIIQTNGTMSIDPNEVSTLVITNGLVGYTCTVQDRDAITKVIGYLNSYTLEDGNDAWNEWNGWHYQIQMQDSAGEALYELTVTGSSQIIFDGLGYSVDAEALETYVEKLECDTMTDNQLIDRLLNSSELSGLQITDENGNISLDKLLKLTDSCPTLFELLGRTTAIQSISSYGLDAIKENLNGADTYLKEQAETLAEIIKEYLPDLSEEIDKLLAK